MNPTSSDAPLFVVVVFLCEVTAVVIQLSLYTMHTDSITPTSTFLPHVYFLWSPPVRIQHLSPSTFKYFNLRESQYPRREQAERSGWSQFETEYLLKHFACAYLLTGP